MTIKENIIYYLGGGLIGGVLSWLFFHSWWGILPMLFCVWLLRKRVTDELIEWRDARFERGFCLYLKQLDSHVRLGHSLSKAVVEAAEETDVFADEQALLQSLTMNAYVVDVFRQLANKKKNENLTFFADILESSLQSGSDFHKIISNINSQIQDKARMEDEIRRLLTKSRFEALILLVLVPAMLLYLNLVSPGFAEVMYGQPAGVLAMIVFLIMYGFAAYLCYIFAKVEI